ncbi:hypothetical protein GKZ28_18825 [Clostridium chromiireducens]|uniref:Uncharacterized protein n=1 Tax=Clostridium chromiireducens TaxID=225345 RepID=A0A964W400_9CLOT|nr:hypothetical protein [Clostridium chromiireducens]MVX65737.1 hypothetical protein [Clostridium chromiireducens]
MNYDKIILELMSRVQNLEEQVADVKNELASRKYEEFEDDIDDYVNEQEEFTRSQARDKAMKIIQSKFPNYLVEKASRKEGSGIKIIKADKNSKRAIIIKFYHSKIHEDKNGLDHAWHTINLDEIIGTIYDFCLFSVVDKNGDWNFFIYEPDELGFYRDENRSTNSELFHLYFSIKDGKAVEIREKTIDVTDHLNNWNVLK